MKLTDCQVAVGDYEVDALGHPLSSHTIRGVRQPYVFLAFMRKYSESSDILAIHNEWAEVRHPIMVCGNPLCVNVDHMRFGRFHPTTNEPETSYNADGIAREVSDFVTSKNERDAMSEISKIKKQLSELTDEELLAIVKGERNTRLTAADAGMKKAAAKREVKADRMQKVVGDLRGLTQEQKDDLKKLLTGG